MSGISKAKQRHLATCSISGCRQMISDNCSLHVFPNEKDPRRRQWIRILKVEKDVPRHYRICSKHFKSSDFFPRHQLQKKLMLRPTAVPTENLPPEITNAPFVERPDTPEDLNTSEDNSSFTTSLNQSDSNTNIILPINEFTDDNGHVLSDSLNNHFNYHYTTTSTPATIAQINSSTSTFMTTSYEPISLATVPYTEIKEEHSFYDGTDIDSSSLGVFRKDEHDDDFNTNDNTITYTISYLDY